ncbi:hypothetical protein D3C86_1932620 [compost metagenome]
MDLHVFIVTGILTSLIERSGLSFITTEDIALTKFTVPDLNRLIVDLLNFSSGHQASFLVTTSIIRLADRKILGANQDLGQLTQGLI